MVGTQGYSYKTDDLPKSSYSLTLLPSAGVNTITTYTQGTDGTLTPEYYQVKLEKTTYGDSALAGTKTYGWEQNASGNLEFKESPTAPYGGTEITAKYDTTNTGRRNNDFTTGENVNGNWTKTSTGAYIDGGAIYNSNTIGNITGDFTDNSISSSGGAIYNRGTIGDITGNFIGNSITGNSGGAIYNRGTIGDITGNFIGNSITADSPIGAAIRHENGSIGNITGDFIGNYSKSTGSTIRGGVLRLASSNIENITGNFIGNYSQTLNNGDIYGGVMRLDSSNIGGITGDFIGNYGQSTNGQTLGGVFCVYGTIDNITGDFIGNYAKSKSATRGGVIYNTNSTINNITGNFIGNYAESTNGTAQGGVIDNDYNSTIKNVTGNFIGNYAKSTGATRGGAIYNTSGGTATIKNSVFANNATIENGISTEKGGAVYNNTNATLNLENTAFAPEGKITINGIEYDAKNDIYNQGTINASGENYFGSEIANSGTINASGANYFGSKIGGGGYGNLKFENGAVAFIGADVSNQKITMDNNTINMGQNGSFGAGNSLNVASTTNINAQNGAINSMDFGEITLNDNLNMAMDINLANSTSDSILGDVVAGDGVVNIGTINIMGTDGADNFSLKLADGTVKERVRTNLKSHMGRIFKYGVDYDETTGLLNFRGGGSDSDGFNPNVLAASVAAQLGGYGVQLNSYDEAFRNVDMYMLSSRAQRQAMKYANRYASSDLGVGAAEYTNSPYTNGAGWFRPYGIFESVPLKNGPKVSNVMYGTFMGADSKIRELGGGWDGMLSGYLAYNGSHQSYDGIGIYQNGGTLGAMGALYKGNFFTALTANIGANAGRANTMYGHEDFTMLMGGIASKTGYNWELADGKFIIQPSYLMSYSIVNTFDYTSASGLNIDSKALHAIQMEPALKFIGNLGNGWQPYTGVSFVFNIMDKTKFSANDVSLPQLSIKPYIKYGVGVRKLWGDRCSGFAQVYMTNIGRNGVGAHAGFTYLLGEINK